MYKAILVPIDLGDAQRGKAMIGIAGKLADKGARIILANVVEDIPSYITVEFPRGLLENVRKSAREELEDMAKGAGIKTEVDVRIGRPVTAINTIAEEKGADLIVVASHRPGFQDYLLGSTAAGVVRHAKCSVLVVR